MKRRVTADWIAGLVAVVLIGLGGLVVVKPAIDHWDELYRGDPYRAATTTQTIKTSGARPAERTTVTRKESVSFAERSLGKGGLLFLRFAVVVLAAFLAAAAFHRIVLGSFGLRGSPASGPATAWPVDGPTAASGAPAAETVVEGHTVENGRSASPEANGAELATSIGKFVAWRREELGLSQRELAKRAGISHTVISRLESGQQVPSPKTLERLADAFRVDS